MQRHRERIFNLPPAVLWILALLIGIEGLCQSVSPETYLEILRNFAFVPGRFTYAFDPGRALDFAGLPQDPALRAEAREFFLGNGKPLWWTPLTYALLHGSWLHVAVNSIWFAAFGAAVARRFHALRFLLFCAFGAIAGAGAHYLTHPSNLEPVVGASAVVSGVMGAAVRFAFQPGAPLGAQLGFSILREDDFAYRLPALPLRGIFSNRGAVSFLFFWFLANFLFGITPGAAGIENAAVAWQAHIGGFLFGLFAFRWFDPPGPPVLLRPPHRRPLPRD